MGTLFLLFSGVGYVCSRLLVLHCTGCGCPALYLEGDFWVPNEQAQQRRAR